MLLSYPMIDCDVRNSDGLNIYEIAEQVFDLYAIHVYICSILMIVCFLCAETKSGNDGLPGGFLPI
jgi:hypothetical protein